MRTIWKFELVIDDVCHLSMPEGAQILSVQTQRNILVLWALVDPSAPLTTRHFRIVGTGHAFTDWQQCHYLTSVQTHGGDLVWHVHETFPAGGVTNAVGSQARA